MKQKANVSVVVLTHNRKKDVVECLESLKKSLSGNNVEVVIVDNDSQDGTADEVERQFPEYTLVRSARNLGGAGGRNLGVKNSSGQYVFFVDDDVVINKDTLPELLAAFETGERIGVVQPMVCDRSEPKKIQGLYYWIDLRSGRAFSAGGGETDAGQYQDVVEIPMVGCCWLVRREVLDHVGLFDETFFIPYEDSDLSLRVKKGGYKLVLAPRAKVFHKGKQDTALGTRILSIGITTPSRAYYISRNRIIFMKKHARRGDLPVFLGFWLPLYTVYHSLVILSAGRFDVFGLYWRGIFAGLGTRVSRG